MEPTSQEIYESRDIFYQRQVILIFYLNFFKCDNISTKKKLRPEKKSKQMDAAMVSADTITPKDQPLADRVRNAVRAWLDGCTPPLHSSAPPPGPDVDLDGLLKATDSLLELQRLVSDLLEELVPAYKKVLKANAVATPLPSLQTMVPVVERLLDKLDAACPQSFSGGAGNSRLKFEAADIKKDPGQPNYFGGMTDDVGSLHDVVKKISFTGWSVCSTTNKGVKDIDRASHIKKNLNGKPPERWDPMTADWIIETVSSATMEVTRDDGTKEHVPIPKPLWPIYIYCMQTPVCYEGNYAMRSVTGEGRRTPRLQVQR